MLVPTLIDRLLDGGRSGAWGYGYRAGADAEPTALAALALASHGAAPERTRDALDTLAALQRADGGVPIRADMVEPCWPTALALLAWARAGDARDRSSADLAAAYLSRVEGLAVERSPLFAHDTRVVGWPWVEETHSWVEPTAYAMMALRAAGRGGDARVTEGRLLLLDRCLPDGGWNYGNTRVMHNTLRPFPATTGVALVGLAGEPIGEEVRRSLAYLAAAAPTLRSPLSLAWALLGLRAWDEDPGPATRTAWLTRCVEEPGRRPPDPGHDALLLLAAARSPRVLPPEGER